MQIDSWVEFWVVVKSLKLCLHMYITKHSSHCNRLRSVQNSLTIKILSCGVQSQWIYLQNSSTLKSQGMLWKKVQKDRKTLKARGSEFAVRLCLLVTSEVILIKSYQLDCPNVVWKRITPMDLPKHTQNSPWGFNPKLKGGKVVFSREKTPIFCPMTNGQHWKHIY